MTRQFLLPFLFTIGIFSASNASAQPFGLAMGSPAESLDVESVNIEMGTYRLASVPKSHSQFETYVAQLGPTLGLFRITAYGKHYEDDPTGRGIRAAFDVIKKQLESKYGEGEFTEGWMNDESPYTNPDDWALAVKRMHLYYRTDWRIKDTKPTHNISSVSLSISPLLLGDRPLQMILQYEFTNKRDSLHELYDAMTNTDDADAL